MTFPDLVVVLADDSLVAEACICEAQDVETFCLAELKVPSSVFTFRESTLLLDL